MSQRKVFKKKLTPARKIARAEYHLARKLKVQSTQEKDRFPPVRLKFEDVG